MPRLVVPNSATLHNLKRFLTQNAPFEDDGADAILELDPRWAHMEAAPLAMVAAWGKYWQRHGRRVEVKNVGRQAAYAARMQLFHHLGVEGGPQVSALSEAGRFLPLRQVVRQQDIRGVIGDISALLDMEQDSEGLAAVQYCVSELLRNVLEHSASPDGAFVCANRYDNPKKRSPNRVTIAVADCGQGIGAHLGNVYPEARFDDGVALGLAMRPGVTGALPGIYGTLNNAGAGLFYTRCIAKGTGGYFFMMSGKGSYRLRRARNDDEMTFLFRDPYDEESFDRWPLSYGWNGTVVSVEICTDRVADYNGLFQWIGSRIPNRHTTMGKIRFT